MEKNKKHIFIIGSKGIPANYGGFETFVDKLTAYKKSEDILYHVSCLSDNNEEFIYHNAHCFNVKTPEIGPAKAIYYDIMALRRCIEKSKTLKAVPIIYILGCRIGPFIGHYKKVIQKMGGRLYVNPDGHEWKRSKWSKPVQEYWKVSESLMVKHADLLICDSKGIEAYIQKEYASFMPHTTYISYGAEFIQNVDTECGYENWCYQNKVSPNNYYLIVGRFVPENNYETMIREYILSNSQKDLVIVTTENSVLFQELESKFHFSTNPHIKFVGTIYDQQLLACIRKNAFAYIHGHSVGGTNPSLLEALGMTNLNLLFDVSFNKEVGKECALYWNLEMNSLSNLINQVEMMEPSLILGYGKKARRRIESAYSWDFIRDEYERLFLR